VSLQDLANLGEFIGGLVVIASLAYLAIQVRQNTHSLRTENYARALDRISSIQAQMSREDAFASLFARGAADPSGLEPQERIRFTWAAYEIFGAFEFMFHEARSGAMPEEVWDRWAETTRWWLSFPGIRSWWLAKPAPFSRAFSAFVDDHIGTHPPGSTATERWLEFIRGPQGQAAPARAVTSGTGGGSG